MRVLLTNCSLGRAQRPVFPLGLAYVAAALREHEVACFDAAIADDPLTGMAELAARIRPEVVGVSLRNVDTLQSYDVVSYWPHFAQTVRHLRACCPEAVIVVGGAGFSLFAEAVMRALPELDLGVHMEGEHTFPELLCHLDRPESVRGVFYRRAGAVAFSGPREPADVDRFPLPRWELFDLSAYQGLQAIGVLTKRGCGFDCAYCTYPYLSGKRVRRRRPELVGEEIETLARRHGVREVFLADDVFNWPLDHAEAVCRELARRRLGVRWTAYFSERAIRPDFVQLALEAGCSKFMFSPDGYSDASLAGLGKGMTLREVLAAYSVLERFPAARYKCDFLWNYPRAGLRDALALARLLLRMVRQRHLVGLSVSNVRILPHTRVHQAALAEGRIRPDDPLLTPTFYDPYPGRLVSLAVGAVGALLMQIKRRTRRTIFAATVAPAGVPQAETCDGS